MKRCSVLIALFAVALVPALRAQTAVPTMSADAKQSYNQIKTYLIKAAAKMPEDGYAFQPTKDVRTFGAWIAHVADAQTNICSRIGGTQKNINAAAKTSRADLAAALKDSFDTCDAVYDALTEANSNDPVPLFRGQRPRLSALTFNVTHDNECYGSIAVYLRLKGIVPPSSEPPMPAARN